LVILKFLLVTEEEVSIAKNELSKYLGKDLSPLIKKDTGMGWYIPYKFTSVGANRVYKMNNFIHELKLYRRRKEEENGTSKRYKLNKRTTK